MRSHGFDSWLPPGENPATQALVSTVEEIARDRNWETPRGRVEMLTGIEGVTSRPTRKIVVLGG
jgi:hypothetical protein